MPPLMGVANNVQKPGQKPFRKFGDVEEEREAANGVHDDDLGQHYSHDPGGQAVVHHHPVAGWKAQTNPLSGSPKNSHFHQHLLHSLFKAY